ncbi:hypothetical protein Tco_0937813 [Tanacetum coccineum]|uniref:Uncharacterized protein n=1 Tax=Tanacetum coccineum TaxID=301880 RepID=A0ABQ5DI32_9ASTR
MHSYFSIIDGSFVVRWFDASSLLIIGMRNTVMDNTIVDVENLWEAYSNVGMDVVEIKHVESDKVLQTVKTDMVKHDVEVESSGECVEEIDRVERRSVEADQRWKYARHFVVSKHDVDCTIAIKVRAEGLVRANTDCCYCFDLSLGIASLNGFSGSQFNIFLKPCYSILSD